MASRSETGNSSLVPGLRWVHSTRAVSPLNRLHELSLATAMANCKSETGPPPGSCRKFSSLSSPMNFLTTGFLLVF